MNKNKRLKCKNNRNNYNTIAQFSIFFCKFKTIIL